MTFAVKKMSATAPRRGSPPQKLPGFTLVELVVAIAGGVLVLFALLDIFFIARQALQTGGTREELVQNGRVALERLARDLRQADELVTALPANEIEFQDGHDAAALTYLRYSLQGGDLMRQSAYYSFPSNPTVRVLFNATDESGNPPAKTVIETHPAAEYLTALQFTGTNPIFANLELSDSGITIPLTAAIFVRNLAPQ